MVSAVSMMYLHPPGEPVPRLVHWPEIGRIDVNDSHEAYMMNFSMGGPFDMGCEVVSIAADDEDGLRYLTECITGVQVIALRGIGSGEWMTRLLTWARPRSVEVCQFDRHSVNAALGHRAFWDGVKSLQTAVDRLRGPGVHASTDAMRTETTLTRAIDALTATGYRTPKA